MTVIRRLKVVDSPRLVNVLCIFAYTKRHGLETERFEDSIMIRVRDSSEILQEFEAAMYRLRTHWEGAYWRGKLLSTELLCYLPENGKPEF